MRKLIRFALVAALLPLTTSAAQAQAKPNLSGSWVLQADQSDFGALPAPDSRTDVVDHQEPRLSIRRTTSVQGTAADIELQFVIDGKPHHNVAGGTELVSVLHWEGDVLVVVNTAQSPQGELVITDRYTLSADGKTLTQARSLSIQGQELAQRFVLVKQ